MRFPPAARLGRRGEFRTVFDRGRKAVGPHVVLYLLANDSAESRLGISISKRFGPAVERNRARRQVREAFRQTRHCWSSGYDLVILPRRAGFPAHLEALGREIDALVHRASSVRRAGSSRRPAPRRPSQSHRHGRPS